MLTIDECRKELGQVGEGMTDEEVAQVRDELYNLVNLMFDVWLEE